MEPKRRNATAGLAVCATAFALSAGSAAAGLLPPILGGGATGPSASLDAQRGEAVALGTNPSRTGESRERRVFGVLAHKWTARFGRGVRNPIVADGLIIISGHPTSKRPGSRILALDPRDGNVVWQRRIESAEAPWIAAGGGLVAAIDRQGIVRAFSVKTGAPAWTRNVGDVGSWGEPLIADGVVYLWGGTWTDETTTMATLRASDGKLLWSRTVPINFGGWMALDNKRIFVTDDCGTAVAISRSNGVRAWRYLSDDDHDCDPSLTIVAGGLVFGGKGWVFDAATGERLRLLPQGQPTAVAGDIAYYSQGANGNFGRPTAIHVSTGKKYWATNPFGNGQLPVLAEGTMYVASPRGVEVEVEGFDLRTGKRLVSFETPSHQPSPNVPTGFTGVTVGAGMLLVSDEDRIFAYRPFFRPTASGTDLGWTARAVRAGGRVGFYAALGMKLRRKQRRIELQAARRPGGHFKVVSARQSRSDGTAQFGGVVRRNTRYRLLVPGSSNRPAVTIYAVPRIKIKRIRPVTPTRGVVDVEVRRVPARVLNGATAVAYHGQAREKRLVRLGRAKLQPSGKTSAKGKVRFKLLKRSEVGRRDFVLVCVRGLARRGWGVNDAIERRCGARRISYGGKRSRAASMAEPPRPRALSLRSEPIGQRWTALESAR